MPSYDKNKQYAEKYLATQDRITVRVSKESGLKDAIQNHAQAMGESVQSFILRAIYEAMDREKSDPCLQDWHKGQEEG